MNILYLHGFQSSSSSNTINYLKNNISNDHVVFSIDLPHQPELAINLISDTIKKLKIDIIIGTSLGGLYAYNFEMPRICINPAFQFDMKPGIYKYLNPRINNETHFSIDYNDVLYLKKLKESYKNRLPIDELHYTSYILIGNNDDVVNFDKLSTYTNIYDEIIYDDFEHRLTTEIIDKHIFNLIDKLDKVIDTIKNYGISD